MARCVILVEHNAFKPVLPLICDSIKQFCYYVAYYHASTLVCTGNQRELFLLHPKNTGINTFFNTDGTGNIFAAAAGTVIHPPLTLTFNFGNILLNSQLIHRYLQILQIKISYLAKTCPKAIHISSPDLVFEYS